MALVNSSFTTNNYNNSDNASDDHSADSIINTKLVVTMGGGYPKEMNHESESFREIIQSHKDVYRDCIEMFSS